MKQLGVSLPPPPGWYGSQCRYPFTPGWREALWEYSILSNNTTQWTRPALEPGPLHLESNALSSIRLNNIIIPQERFRPRPARCIVWSREQLLFQARWLVNHLSVTCGFHGYQAEDTKNAVMRENRISEAEENLCQVFTFWGINKIPQTGVGFAHDWLKNPPKFTLNGLINNRVGRGRGLGLW